MAYGQTMSPSLRASPPDARGADAAVRPARPDDADALGQVQAHAWRSSYAEVLPPPLLETVDGAVYAQRWREALQHPPSERHRVLVATDAGSIVGFLALAPSEDRDAEPETEAELTVLVVDPAARACGHGSRLLAAAADTLRENGVTDMLAWVLSRDTAGRQFLSGAGWGADGATRVLDADVTMLAQLRMRTSLH